MDSFPFEGGGAFFFFVAVICSLACGTLNLTEEKHEVKLVKNISKTKIYNKMKKAHFILIVASTVAGIMLNTGCDVTNQYDVRGTWIFTGQYNGVDFNKTLTFSGKRTQGTVTDELDGIAAYTSDGYTVHFDLSIICFCKKNWVGYFIDKDSMEGTLNGCSSGTWTASRI